MANPSLVLGGVVAGAIATTIGIFAIPGWVAGAQDAAAIRDITDIRHAQSVAYDVNGEYLPTLADLNHGEWGVDVGLSDGVSLEDIDAGDKGWCAVVQSPTKKYFAASNWILGVVSGTSQDEALAAANCDIWTPLDAPTTPVVSVSAGSDKVTGVASEVVCGPDTTAQYRIRHRGTQGSAEASWGDFSGWGNARNETVTNPLAGALYEFQAEARCVTGKRDSPVKESTTQQVITAIPAPATPTVTNTTSGNNTTFEWESVCPAGTSIRYYTLDHKNDPAFTAEWSAGAITTSKIRATSGQGFTYKVGVQADCYTAHANSAKSGTGESSYHRPVAKPAAPNTSIITAWEGLTVTNLSPFTCPAGLTREWRGGYFLMAVAPGKKVNGSYKQEVITASLYGGNKAWQDPTLSAENFPTLSSKPWLSGSGYDISSSIGMTLAQAKAKFTQSVEHRQAAQVRCTNPVTKESATSDIGVTPLATTW